MNKDDMSKIDAVNASNLIKRLKAGKPLTETQIRQIEKGMKRDEPAPEAEKDLSVADFANLLNLDVRRVQQLADEGVITRSGRGRYPLTEATGYVKYLQELVSRRKVQTDRPEGALDPEQQRARKDAADADLKELLLEEKRGTVVNVEEIKAEYLKALMAVRAGVLSLGVRVAEEVAAMSEPRKCRARIDKEAWEILENLSKYGSETTSDRDDETPRAAVKRTTKRVGKPRTDSKRRRGGDAGKVSD